MSYDNPIYFWQKKLSIQFENEAVSQYQIYYVQKLIGMDQEQFKVMGKIQ